MFFTILRINYVFLSFSEYKLSSHSRVQNEHVNERTTHSKTVLRITQIKLTFDLVILLRNNWLGDKQNLLKWRLCFS